MRTDTLSAARRDAPLIGDEELERLRLLALQYRARRHAVGAVAGGRPGRRRGAGMDLHDTRPYQAGDDVRHLDWRATARSGKPLTKVFIAEHSHDICLLIDRRPGMLFGTRHELKATTAARLAATLAFHTLADHGAVSGLVLAGGARYFPPRKTAAGVLPLLRAAVAAPGDQAIDGTVMPTAAPPVTPALLYIISDFRDVIQSAATVADYVPAGQRAAVAVRIVDEAEQRLPAAGILRLVAPEGGAPIEVDTRDPELRRRYQALAAQRSAELARQCALHGITLHTITNCRDLHPQIEALL